MSEPWISTGRTKPGPCTHCDATVDYEEYLGAYGSGHHWMVGRHDAPCGLPCMGGGVGGRAYRTGEAHGLLGYPAGKHEATEWDEGGEYPGLPERPCPACTGLPPVPLAEVRRG